MCDYSVVTLINVLKIRSLKGYSLWHIKEVSRSTLNVDFGWSFDTSLVNLFWTLMRKLSK